MKRLLLPLFAASLMATACGTNEADADTTAADTPIVAPVDGSISTGTGAGRSPGNTISNPNNAGGADNSGTGISGGQGNNPNSGSNAAGVSTSVGTSNTSGQRGNNGAPYPVDGISTVDGAAPTSTRANRDNVTNDSLNNRSGMGTSR